MSLDGGPWRPDSPGPSEVLLLEMMLLLSGDGCCGGGHGRGGGVGQRGVPALPTARGVAALRVGRHRAELAVQVGEDPSHRHHVGSLQPQRLSNFPVLARPVGLPGVKAHRGWLAGGGHRSGSVQYGTAGDRDETLRGEVIRRSRQRHFFFYLDRFQFF